MATEPNIYAQFDRATENVGAFAILDSERRYVGRVVLRYPTGGAARLRCFAQVWGAAMQSGHVGGFGYDKATAAFEAAARKLSADSETLPDSTVGRSLDAFRAAAADRDGWNWSQRLEQRGFTVLNVTG